jgi:hypothetical protein
MKRLALGAVAMCVVGGAWAQQPPPQPQAPDYVPMTFDRKEYETLLQYIENYGIPIKDADDTGAILKQWKSYSGYLRNYIMQKEQIAQKAFADAQAAQEAVVVVAAVNRLAP